MKINWKEKPHKDWVNVNIDLSTCMALFKRTSPEWYVKRRNKNEVKGKIDRFGKFLSEHNKDVIPAQFYFLVDATTKYDLKLIVVDGRHRLAYLLENGYKKAVISVPKNQRRLFKQIVNLKLKK